MDFLNIGIMWEALLSRILDFNTLKLKFLPFDVRKKALSE